MSPRLRSAALACPLIVVLLAGCTGAETAAVEVGEVSRRTVTEVVEAPATVVAKASATVSAPAEGTVGQLLVKDGDRVRAGQVLMRIDSPQARERLRQARAAATAGPSVGSGRLPASDLTAEQRRLDAAAATSFRTAREAAESLPQPRRREALAEVARAEASYRSARAASTEATRGFVDGVRSLNSSIAALQRAQNAQARAAVVLARQAVDALTVRAPIDGIVHLADGSRGGGDAPSLDALPEGVRGQAEQLLGSAGGAGGDSSGGGPVSVGAPVSAGAPLLTLTDDSSLSLSADVDETDVLLLRPGVPAQADIEAVPGARYNASVVSVGVSPSAGGGTGGSVTYPVRLSLGSGRTEAGETAPRPRPGMSAIVRFDVRTAVDVPSVPASAIVRDGGRDAVWVVEDGRARRRQVRLGAQGDNFVEVVEGLAPGERVVVRGADKLTDDQQVP